MKGCLVFLDFRLNTKSTSNNLPGNLGSWCFRPFDFLACRKIEKGLMQRGLGSCHALGLEDIWSRAFRRAGGKGPGSSLLPLNLLVNLFVKLFDFSLPLFPLWWKEIDIAYCRVLWSWGEGRIKTPGPHYKCIRSELHCQGALIIYCPSHFDSMTIHPQSPLQMPQNRITVAVAITHLVYLASAELNIQIRSKEPSVQWRFWRTKVLDTQHFFTPKLKLKIHKLYSP